MSYSRFRENTERQVILFEISQFRRRQDLWLTLACSIAACSVSNTGTTLETSGVDRGIGAAAGVINTVCSGCCGF